MKSILGAICLICTLVHIPTAGNAIDGMEIDTPPEINSSEIISVDNLLNTPTGDTQCATKVFADALGAALNDADEIISEEKVQITIYNTFEAANVLQQVLECPEIAGAAEDESIKFIPIEYTFPGGRRIVVNYETEPRVLKQHLTLATKRNSPGADSNPNLDNITDGTVWTNTDPAWYGIMVVEHDALRNFVGPDKNNTISMRYINDNIDRLYPSGFMCTSKSALANDKDEINQAVTRTVGLPDGKDSNDYYVAGDVNLQWISYTEIALDIAITIATAGGGAVVLGATKGARATRALHGLNNTIKALRKTESVTKYVKTAQKYERAAKELKNIDKAKDAAAYARKSEEVKQLGDSMRTLERTDDNVKQYKKATDSYREINQLRHNLRAMKLPQRGNIVARAFRAFKAANTGNKAINKGAKIARSSMKSGRIRDRLFQSTLRNAGKLAKLEETGGFLYGAITFIGDMYDYTPTSTGEFTNGIDFKPLLLLSADDLEGQENVVNYGMWLMWAGDATSANDDDAAYLQAMDFAEKFWQDLNLHQEESGTHHCNIDIYIVRPIIRNPGTEDSELYYLIMNDEPWTTAE
ncbi:hypothetical protein HDR61_00850 [bacterium]|nr:hypothetical protein [bacterium]